MIALVVRGVEEAAGLLRWSALFRQGLEDDDPILVFLVRDDRGEMEKSLPDVGADLELRKVDHAQPLDEILGQLDDVDIELLVIGKQGAERSDNALPGQLFQRASCAALLLRLIGSDGSRCEKVLIPTAGGPHARFALRMSAGLVPETGQVCPLFVEPAAGPDPERAGARILDRFVREDRIPGGRGALVVPRGKRRRGEERRAGREGKSRGTADH